MKFRDGRVVLQPLQLADSRTNSILADLIVPEFAWWHSGDEHLFNFFQTTTFKLGQEEEAPDERKEADGAVDEADF